MSDLLNPPPLANGEYAIVELMGHTRLAGRVSEVERFGVKMIAIETVFADQLLPPVYHGGSAIFRFTPCSPEQARTYQVRRAYELPETMLCLLPPSIALATAIDDLSGDVDDAERVF